MRQTLILAYRGYSLKNIYISVKNTGRLKSIQSVPIKKNV
ncbi:hypothetical protein NEILACOT_03961 [Neisseria lactamica ATCC 23970]|uniref:Uncharacterized protein n=1 Tax=Neisseria lactamica ATCC 23970 TaxID=546265 RepID=D0W8V7_NEILA|nr:hypothetical protein NEILACOT_03961 [Neisseria lactamica ATCC 23970]